MTIIRITRMHICFSVSFAFLCSHQFFSIFVYAVFDDRRNNYDKQTVFFAVVRAMSLPRYFRLLQLFGPCFFSFFFRHGSTSNLRFRLRLDCFGDVATPTRECCCSRARISHGPSSTERQNIYKNALKNNSLCPFCCPVPFPPLILHQNSISPIFTVRFFLMLFVCK